MNAQHSTSDSARLRLGVIGCGAIGQRRHIREAALNPHVTLAALCDVNLDRAKSVASQHNVANTYSDYRELIKNEPLDVVVVATPNASHAQQAIAALEAGRDVLVEKPMATTLADADAMIAAAAKHGRRLMVGMNQRLMPPHVKAKRILDSGALGKPLNFQTSFKHGGPDDWSVDGAKSWFFKREPAVMGVCGDLGVHKVDLLQFLLNQKITHVGGFIGTLSKTYAGTSTLIEVDDTAFLSVRTDAGVIGSINVTWTHYGHSEDNGTTIYCENGTIEIGTNPTYSVVVNYRDGTKEFHQTGAASTNAVQTGSGVIDAFVDAIRGNRQPIITGQDGRQALKVILAAFDSSRTGAMVKVD